MNLDKFDRGVFITNVLGIIFDSKAGQILIGRRENDPYIKELTWCFPGGRPGYNEDLESYLMSEIKNKTHLDIRVKNIVFAKTYPENRQFLSIYYLCEPLIADEMPGGNIKELKWIDPSKVEEYFTSSIHPKIIEYLKSLQNHSEV